VTLFRAKSHRQAAPPAADSRSPGQQLIAARERWGMSRQQVASTLRLPDNVIAALEGEDYRGLPPAAFVRGYLSGYARLVGLDASELVVACEMHGCGDPALAAKHSLSLKKSCGEKLLRWGSYAALSAFVVSAMLYWTQSEQQLSAPAMIAANIDNGIDNGTTISATPPSPADKGIDSRPQGIPGEPAAARSGLTPTLAPTNPAPEQDAGHGSKLATATTLAPRHASTNSADRDSSSATAAEKSRALDIKFHADSWLAVRDADGKRLAWETVKAGSTRHLRGTPPLKVVLGNAAAANITLAGEPFDTTPFTVGRIARFSVK